MYVDKVCLFNKELDIMQETFIIVHYTPAIFSIMFAGVPVWQGG